MHMCFCVFMYMIKAIILTTQKHATTSKLRIKEEKEKE